MQRANWNAYQAFLAVANGGQLARAAKLLGVDPTTVGRQLRRLESALGQTLFEQTREGQILTEAGERLLVEVERMAAAAARISSSTPTESGLSGTLRVGAPEGFGTWFLGRHLGEFGLNHPRLTIDLVANSSYLSLSKREADVAVFLSRPKAGPLIAQRLTGYTLKLYASQSYLERKGVPRTPAALAEGHVLVGYIPDLLYAPELRYLDEIYDGLAAHLRSSSINAQHRLVADGAGIGVLPCFIGDADSSLSSIIQEQSISRRFWLVTHKDTQQLAKVRAFVGWLKNLVKLHQGSLLPRV